MELSAITGLPYISIHAPPRGATSVFWHCALITYYFNSRPSARGDMRSENVLIPRSISIHAPPRGATNQPPRVTRIGIIPIHAPPRGATENKNAFLAGIDISIHAPPRGATWSFPPSRDYPTFQFTPLREGRLKTQEFHAMAAISIHAPPRGATSIRAVCTSSASAFQFTPLREGRPAGQSAMGNRNDFNSRPSARGDGLVMPRMPSLLFQFTPLREGRHKAKFEGMRLTDISIHAPPRGATQ